MSFSEIATPYEPNDWHKGFEIMKGKLSEATAKGECICYFSQRLCFRHGDEMTSIKRDVSIKLALCDFRDIELIAAAGVMDKAASKTIASFLRSDIAPPSRVRQFLADAIEGKNEHWRIEWKAMKSGGARTSKRYNAKFHRDKAIERAANEALRAIEFGEPVEAAIAQMQQDARITRAAAFEALKACRTQQQGRNRAIGYSLED